MDRAKTLLLERGRLVAKKASGGVNLFYSEAPNSNASWWQKMFGEAEATEDDTQITSGGASPQASSTEQSGDRDG
jgi:hypothetical protein